MASWIGILLWLQAAYAIWQFVRSAKYFRLPYALASAVWHGELALYIPKKRKVLRLMPFIDQNLHETIFNAGDADEIECRSHGREALFKSGHMYYGGSNALLTCKLKKLQASGSHVVASKMDLLWFDFWLCDRGEVGDIYGLLNESHDVVEEELWCIVDVSTKDDLNQSVMQLLSMGPLLLQAKNLSVPSLGFSLFLIVVDVFSHQCDILWTFLKDWLCVVIKVLISLLNDSAKRKEVLVFLSSFSSMFMYSEVLKGKSYYANGKVLLVNDVYPVSEKGRGAWYHIDELVDDDKSLPDEGTEVMVCMNAWFEILYKVSPEWDPEDGEEKFYVCTYSCNGVQYLEEDGTSVKDILKMRRVIKLSAEKGFFIVEGLAAGRLQAPKPKDFFYQLRFYNWVLVLDEEKKYFIS